MLVRLPDVTGRQAAPTIRRDAQRSAPPAERPSTTGYRFDPPESFGPHMTTDQTAAATTGAGRTTIRADRQGEPRPATRRGQPSRRRTNPLPASNLFNVRGKGTASALSTVAQFLLLFTLFTVVGGSLLVMQTASQWTTDNAGKTPPAADQATTGPAATGPAGVEARPDWDLPEPPPTALRPHAELSPISESDHDPDPAGGKPQASEETTPLPYPTTDCPPAVLPEGIERPLPRIRTTDDSPAVARLPGYVLEAPHRQAHDDRNEPSLH